MIAGLEDWRRGVESVPGLLAQIGAPLPEHRLYELLAREHGDAAHSRYNALLRQLVSFTRSRACAR